MHGLRVIELTDPSRAARLAKHPNVEAIRRGKDHQIVQLQVHETSDDSNLPAHHGNPLAYVYREEVVAGLAPIFVLKHLPKHTRNIFRAVVLDCAA